MVAEVQSEHIDNLATLNPGQDKANIIEDSGSLFIQPFIHFIDNGTGWNV